MTETSNFKLELKKKLFIPKLIASICSALMLLTLVLPFVSATDDFRDVIDGYELSDVLFDDALTIYEAKEMSILVFTLKVKDISESLDYQVDESLLYICYGFIGLVTLMSLVMLVLSLFKRPVPIIVFLIIISLLFASLSWVLVLVEIVQDDMYNFGMAFYLFITLAFFIFASAIWMLCVKLIYKKRAGKQTEAVQPVLIEESITVEQTSEEVTKGWECSCGNISTGKFCSVCGSKKSELKCVNCDWTCDDLEMKYVFCPNCGTEL